MLLAKLAVLIELQTIWIIFLILVGLIVTALAFRACQRNRVTHLLHPLPRKKIDSIQKITNILYHTYKGVSTTPLALYAKNQAPFQGLLYSMVAAQRLELRTLRV